MKAEVLMFVPMLVLVLAGCTGTASDSLAPRFITAEEKTCEIHHVRMHKKSVAIFHGLLVLSEYDFKLAKAAKDLFPHAEDEVLVTSDEPGEAVVFECPECRRAKHEWIIAHQEEKDAKKG